MLIKRAFSVVFAVAVAAASQAVTLNSGVFTPLPGIPFISGTVLQDVLTPFSFSAYNGTVSGEVQNRVTRKADNTLLFEWRVFNDANSAGPVQDWRVGGFFANAYDGNWESAGLGDISPTHAKYFGPGTGDVNFNFSNADGRPELSPGKSSFFFYLNTDATQYGKVAWYDLTNYGQTQNSQEYSTFAPVPEPAPVAAMGIGALALLRRRKTRNA